MIEISDDANKFFDVTKTWDLSVLKTKDQFENLCKSIDVTDASLINFLTNENYGEKTLASYTQYLKDQNKVIDLQTLKTKALTIAKNAMVNVGMAVVSTLIANGIGFVVEQLDNYIHRLDIAKEKLSDTQSELDTVNSEIAETNKKIAELTALDPSSLSITDKEDLQRLKDQNEELRIRQQYLKDQEKYDASEVAKLAKEKYQKKYSGETTRENIDAYKSTMYSEYEDTYANTGYSIYENPNFSPSVQAEYESDTLTVLIATLEHLREERQKAINAQDSEAIEEYNTQIKETEASLRAERLELQGLRDDMEAVGGVEFEDANHRIGMIDDALYTPGQNLVTFINEDITDNDKNKLVELAESGKLTSDVLKKSFSEVDEYLKNNGLTIEDLVSVLDVYKEEIQEIEEEASKIPSTKTQMIDTINSMADGFDVLDDIYADVLDGGTFDFTKLDTSKFSEAFSEITPEYEKFIETVSASPTDIEACQGAFNDLVSAFIDSKGILEGVDEETKQLTIDMLENMGVVNAEEVVTETLAQKKRNLAIETEVARLEAERFAFATLSEVNALINVEDGVSVAEIALARYTLEKMKTNGIVIDESSDIEEILKLGEAALLSAECMAELSRAKVVLGAVEKANGDLESAGVAMWEYTDALNTVDKLNSGTYEFKTTAIDLTSVLSNYGGATKTAAAANKNLKNATDASNDALKAQKEQLEKNKEALEETKSEYEELYDAIQWFYDTKIDKINDTIDKINEEIDLLEKQQATMDDIIKAIENNYDAEISLIQDKIDALKDANDEEEKALKLEEAKRKLQEAKSRKTLMVYTKNAGFTYQVDTSAIKEAESELAELQENEVVNELEKQIDALEEAKEKWSEIPDAYNKAMQEIAASNYFGANWKDITLLPSDELLANFEGKYTGIQSSIDSKNDKIDSLEKEKQKLEELKSLWEDAKNSYRNSQYEAQLASFFGSDYEYQLLNNSASWRRKFASEYSSICAEIASVEEQLKSLNEETASSVESGANRISNAANGVRSALENTGNISKYIWTEDDTNALEYARQRLDALNQLIGQGRTELTDARDKVANFVDQYSKLKDSRLVTDELKNSVQELNGVYGQSGDYLEQMASGVANRLADSKNYTSELVQNTQTTADNLAQVNDQINNLKTSEETIESEANETVSNVEITISNLLTKLGELQTKLGEISLSRTEVEAIADEELLDTSAVVDGVHTKVSEIQTAITTLMESITPLHGALDTLMEKMTTLDEVTLSKVISAFGGAYGGEGGESKESGSKSSSKGKKGSEGESGGGSGLLSAVKAVDEAIGSVDNEESLLGKLAQVDASTLENIIAQFGLSGENGDSEGANLLNAVNAVSTAIVGGGKDDENSLIASIEQLGSDPTIEHVTTVSDSFQTLHDTINECVKKVEELSKAIESIPSSTATVGVNGGKSSGRAKGGIITKEDAGDLDFVANSLGEDHMVALTEGEAVIPKETVAKNPEAIDSLLSGQKLDLKSLVNRDIVLQRATPMYTYSMFEKYKDWVIPDSVIMSRLNLPSQDFSKLGVVNNNQKETVVQFNGDIHVHEVQNVDTLSKAIVQQLPRKMTQALSRRDL